MSKFKILCLAIIALTFTSCDLKNKDSYYDMTYGEANLIVNTKDPGQTASVSESAYKFHYNMSKNVVDVSTADLIIDNHKISFETDTMAPTSKRFGEKLAYLGFSKPGNVGKGASVTNLNGYIPYQYVATSTNLFSSNYKFEYSYTERLLLNYELNEEYRISTFKPFSTYVGSTHVSEESNIYSTKNTGYVVDIDFSKNKAKVYVLGMELEANPKSTDPKVMLLEDIPVVFTHDGFKLEANAPKTTIPGVVDNKSAFVESDNYKVTDFSISYVYPELVDVAINYIVAGKRVNFVGTSIVKTAE